MKTNFLIKSYFRTVSILTLVVAMLFTSCQEEEAGGGPITINKVFLEDVNSNVRDREVNFVRLGQGLRIEGTGFTGLKKVFINGVEVYFNNVYVTDNNVLVGIPVDDVPVADADPAVRNTIRFVNDNYEFTYEINIRSSAPTISNISNTLPNVGETITITGTGLTEVSKVTFPGGVVVSSGIISDEDGEFFTVKMPTGVSPDGGSIFVESANGGAFSPAYFNARNNLIINFDGVGAHGFWGSNASMIQDTDLQSSALGSGNVSQGTYVSHIPSRITSFPAAKNRNSEVWTSGGENWRSLFTGKIPATTPVSEIAFQFDIYVPQEWSLTGYLKINLVNGFNGGEWSGNCYNYVPWLVNGKVVPFKTTGWTTVTIPLSELYAFSSDTEEFTFDDVIAVREGATYANFGMYYENSDFLLSQVTGLSSTTEFLSKATTTKVYTDNWRIVSLATPEYNDFPE